MVEFVTLAMTFGGLLRADVPPHPSHFTVFKIGFELESLAARAQHYFNVRLHYCYFLFCGQHYLELHGSRDGEKTRSYR